jgi:DUF971 family protein
MAISAPTDIKYLQKLRLLEITFANGEFYQLPCAYLRENSPAAEKHGQSKPAIKANINIIGIDPVGHYAIKLIFDDGHDTGIYTWEYLHNLGQNLTNEDLTPS